MITELLEEAGGSKRELLILTFDSLRVTADGFIILTHYNCVDSLKLHLIKLARNFNMWLKLS